MILNIARCPHCGGTAFAVEVKTWVNVEAAAEHSDQYPRFAGAVFDPEDAHYAEPIDGGEIICRECHTIFANVAAPL
jgi:hypothetical protein